MRQQHHRAGECTSAHAQLTAHINFTSGICLFLVADGHYNLHLGMFFPCTGCWLASLYAAGADAGIRCWYNCSCDCWRRLLVSARCSGGAVALVVEAANSCIPSRQLHSAMPERRRDEFWRFLLVGRSSHLPCGLSWLTTGWSVHRVNDGCFTTVLSFGAIIFHTPVQLSLVT